MSAKETTKLQIKFNDEQTDCIARINKFIETHSMYSKLLINGSAGTGKTTILISSIINYIASQINERYDFVKIAINNHSLDSLNFIKKFIISAPTNKAKDVLVSKYNIYLNNLKDNPNEDINIDRYVLNEIVNNNIDFLTVSQILSISRVINEMGEEEFTKGNEKKIADKYNKSIYENTIIIIDECSMLDTNTTKLLNIIRCPIIYIGDYCQLPPVNEILSPVFNMEGDLNIEIIRLLKVERCKNKITDVANNLRDKIYDVVPDFNLIKHKITDMVFYQKKMEKWLDVYVEDIKKKQIEIECITKDRINQSSGDKSISGNIVNDTMALAWTNKCCSMLNQKIRRKLFIDNICNNSSSNTPNAIDKYEGIEDIDEHFLVKGDKLLVKAPYYKYGHRIYSSSIIYVANLQKTQYTPLTFREWCKLGMLIQEDAKSTNIVNMVCNAVGNAAIGNASIGFDINLEDVLDTKPEIKQSKKTLLDYFNKNTCNEGNEGNKGNDCSNNNYSSKELSAEEIERKRILEEQKELQRYRMMFYRYHNLQSIVNADVYNFNDEVSIKYNKINDKRCDLLDIKLLPSLELRAAVYNEWHQIVSTILFGIPIENVLCKKCMFFIKKFGGHMEKSCYVADMNDITEKLKLDMYLTDIATFTTSSKYINSRIPILDMSVKSNLEDIDSVKNIVRNSYEVKIILSKQDEHELKAINKMLNEDDANNTTPQKYITMSQMFGHYLHHIITSTYLEVDYGYALTVHKSQGSTYDDVYIEYNNLLANKKDTEKYKLLYTAITRCSNKLHIYY